MKISKTNATNLIRYAKIYTGDIKTLDLVYKKLNKLGYHWYNEKVIEHIKNSIVFIYTLKYSKCLEYALIDKEFELLKNIPEISASEIINWDIIDCSNGNN